LKGGDGGANKIKSSIKSMNVVEEFFMNSSKQRRCVMKKVAIALLMVIIPSFALAATFAPTPLTITAPAEFEYAFQGSSLSMPITVGGTNAQYVFAVYTSDKGAMIGRVRNGYLGWHTVNKIDTCLYVSAPTNASMGSATVAWDGKDTYGTVLPADTYNYYIWAFDNVTP